MSIKKTLTLLFIFAILSLVSIGGYTFLSYKNLVDESLSISEQYSSMEALALTTQVHFKKQVQEWKNILIRGTDKAMYEKYLSQFKTEEALTNKYVDLLLTKIKPGSSKMTAIEFKMAHIALGVQYREALPAFNLSEHSPHIIVDNYVKGIDRKPTNLIDQLVKQLKADKSNALGDLKIDVDNALQSLVIIISSFTFFLITLISFLLNKIIIKPLLTATKIATEISKGNYKNKIEYGNTSNENNRLLHALDSMQTSIGNSALNIAENNKQLRNALHHAQESERLRSSFIANLNHELITPMTGVLGLIELLSDTKLDHQQTEFVSLAKESSERFLKTVNNVIKLSHIESDRFIISDEVINLNQCLNEIVKEHRPAAEKIKLYLKFPTQNDLPEWVYGDRTNLKQIISILLENAIKFTTSGGVSFRAKIQAQNGQHVLIKFTIDDTGKGISRSELNNIFDSFRQEDGSASRSHEGLGVGLSIFYKIVGLMGGEVHVDSTVGKGSSFSFNIPFEISSHPART